MSVMALQLVLDVILKENGQPKFCSFLGVGLHCHQPKRLEFWGWVHHKFRENNKEPLKEATPGNSYFLSAHQSLDSQDAYPTACAGPRHNTGVRKQLNLFQDRSFAGPMENTEEIFKDHRNSDFFHGFLAIGTLGGETLLDEPATPTFGMSSEDPGKDYADVTENDLKLISNELEKFLEAEAKEGHNQPSGRNSDTNTIASTIEAIEALDAEEDSQPMKFPLQEYLFGSLIELPETKIADKKERASLGDLFRKIEMQDTQPETKYGKKNNQTSSTHKSAKHLVKKVLKKLHPSSRSSASGKTEVASKKKKFQKMVQVFHRKIHPEDSMMESEIYSRMENPKYSEASSIGLMSENPCNETSKRWIQYELRNSRSASNGEHWIKTDEDYFVLEL
ncbi:unnamed protein product [Arabis nemorensis]|uniref:Protein LAZY 1 n=1 Tax=Arabis nemorensis TaxID=586526 RepID=A0A565CLE1_9BRAS|nr:unnamed protein product [Arabis nemorensis]